MVASVYYVVTWQVIYFKLLPDFAAKFRSEMIEQARAKGGSQASIDKRVADMQRFAEMYQNPAINAAITFIEPLPVGLIIALVSSGILRRRKAPALGDGVTVAT